MKTTLLTVAALSLASTFALAQQQPVPATPPAANPPAVMPPVVTPPAMPNRMAPKHGTPTTAMPVPGANSFTEAQARERITEAGYTDVGPLRLDDKGVWRGMAMKAGASVNVALDYQGNVVEH